MDTALPETPMTRFGALEAGVLAIALIAAAPSVVPIYSINMLLSWADISKRLKRQMQVMMIFIRDLIELE